MSAYREHIHLLVLALLGLVALFLLFSLLPWRAFTAPILHSILVILLAMWVLARFGGGLGRAD